MSGYVRVPKDCTLGLDDGCDPPTRVGQLFRAKLEADKQRGGVVILTAQFIIEKDQAEYISHMFGLAEHPRKDG